MPEKIQKVDPIRAIAPHGALFGGAFLGWLGGWIAGQAVTEFVPILGRFQAISNSLVFWAIFSAFAQKRQIYGGGLLEIEEAERQVIQLKCVLFLVMCFSAFGLYAGSKFMPSALITGALLIMLVGEICFGELFGLLRLRIASSAK